MASSLISTWARSATRRFGHVSNGSTRQPSRWGERSARPPGRPARSVDDPVPWAKELEALGVDPVVLDQGIDSTTPSGRLLFHVLAAIAEFERELIRERVLAGLRRARARGKRLGRPPTHHVTPSAARAALQEHGGRLRATARALKLHPETLRR